ncbi:MAG: hypothetical protein KDD61_01765, partial [Bdellovibrionales bacterium]|nr:hypothetical protein [Bdellovibrionales bacterium]
MKSILRENLFDVTVIFLSLLVGAGSSWVLSNSTLIYQLAGIQKSNSNVIGEIDSIQKDVRRRAQKSILWQPINRKETIFEGDSVFTGSESQATIALDSGDSLSLSPNSVVIVETEDGKINLDLQIGSVVARLGRNQSLNIRQNNEVVKVKSSGANSTINITKDKKKISLQSIEGKAQLTSKGKILQLSKSTLVEVTKNEPIKESLIQLDLEGPSKNEEVWLSNKDPLTFVWKGETKVQKAQLQASRKSDFSDKFFEKSITVKTHRTSGNLQPGSYWWKIVDNKGNTLSETETFIVVSKSGPKLLYPMKDESLFPEQTEPTPDGFSIDFYWKRNKFAKTYQLDISTEENFSANVRSLKVADPQSTQKLDANKYYWRVRSIGRTQQLGHWSEVNSFEVGKPAEDIPLVIEPPVIETPVVETPAPKPEPVRKVASKPKKIIPFKTPLINPIRSIKKQVKTPEALLKESLPVAISWESDKRSNGYKIQISRNDDFSSILDEQIVTDSSVKVALKDNGRYYIRVTAFKDKKRSQGPMSPVETFDLNKYFFLNIPRMITNPGKDVKVV